MHLSGNVVTLNRISPIVCKIVFNATVATNTRLTNLDLPELSLVMNGEADQAFVDRSEPVQDAARLCARLKQVSRAWMTAMATPPPELMSAPSGDPGEEEVLDADPTGVAARCEEILDQITRHASRRIVRRMVSRNLTVGVVLRADIQAGDDPTSTQRDWCWQSPETGKLVVSVAFNPPRPLPPRIQPAHP